MHVTLRYILITLFFYSPVIVASEQTQKVFFDPYATDISANESAAIPVFYESENNLLATGIGFTIHFDSSQVQLNSIDNLFRQSKVGVQVLSDDEDLDQNPDTDSYVTAGWANINGGWPDTVIQPVKLFDLNIRTTSEFEESDLVIKIKFSDVNFNGVGDSITLSNGISNDEPNGISNDEPKRQLLFKQFDRE